MIELPPRVLISLACDVASYGIKLRNDLQFYVRDGKDVWIGHCLYNKEVVYSSTLEDLRKQMERVYEESIKTNT